MTEQKLKSQRRPWYTREKVVDGIMTVRHWHEDFRDEDSKDVVTIKRSEPYMLNGKRLHFHGKTPPGFKAVNLNPVKL